MLIAFTYLPGFVTLVLRGMPTVWRGRHRLIFCWLMFMQAVHPGRHTLEEMTRWTPASITAWRFGRLLKAAYWNVHLLVVPSMSCWADDAVRWWTTAAAPPRGGHQPARRRRDGCPRCQPPPWQPNGPLPPGQPPPHGHDGGRQGGQGGAPALLAAAQRGRRTRGRVARRAWRGRGRARGLPRTRGVGGRGPGVGAGANRGRRPPPPGAPP